MKTGKPKIYIILLIAIVPVALAALYNLITDSADAVGDTFERFGMTAFLPAEYRKSLSLTEPSELDDDEVARYTDKDGATACSITRAAAAEAQSGGDPDCFFATDGEWLYAVSVPEDSGADEGMLAVLEAYFIADNGLTQYSPELARTKQELSDAEMKLELLRQQTDITLKFLKTCRYTAEGKYIASSVINIFTDYAIGCVGTEDGRSEYSVYSNGVMFEFKIPDEWSCRCGIIDGVSIDADSVLYMPWSVIMKGGEQIGSISVGKFDILPVTGGVLAVPGLITALSVDKTPDYEIIDDGTGGDMTLLYDLSGYVQVFNGTASEPSSGENKNYYLIFACDVSGKYIAAALKMNAVSRGDAREIAESVSVTATEE